MSSRRILVVASHPDDEMLGVGGTILRHVDAGDTVRVHIESCADLRDRDARLVAAGRVAAAAGYELTLGSSRQLGYAVPALDALVREFNPDRVYTHYPFDLNRDHRNVYEGVAVACRPFAANVGELLVFDTPSSTEWGMGRFTPNVYVDIAAQLERKMALLDEYAGELRDDPHPRSREGVRARARTWGGMSGYWAAEAFVLVRSRW